MTGEVQDWVKSCVERFPLKGAVLEVGSRDVCGNPRHHFNDRERFPSYIGVDREAGNNVDLVIDANYLTPRSLSPYPRPNVIVCCEMIEHDQRFWESIERMESVLEPGGYLLLTTRSWRGCPPHCVPHDYWRFLAEGLRVLMEQVGLECLETVDCEQDGGVFAIGRKP